MHEMAGHAGDAFEAVLGLFPVDVLLVVGLGELVSIEVPGVAAGKGRGLERTGEANGWL